MGNGYRDPSVPGVTLPRGLVGAQPAVAGQLDNRAGRITYWSFKDLNNAAGSEVVLWDGSGASGIQIADISLTQNQSFRDHFQAHALPYRTGLYLQIVSGSVNAQVFTINESEWEANGQPVYVVNLFEIAPSS